MEEVEEACRYTTKENIQKVFSDDKQLIWHQQKQDMVLSLNKPNHFPTDETPTPTRFIQTCEAIGLFQDLQSVNPFDETFKKATEAVKKGEAISTPNVSTLGKAAGEDLHTPHIDLTSEGLSSSNDGNEKGYLDKVVRSEADTSLSPSIISPQKLTAPVNEDINKDKAKSPDKDLRLLLRMPDGSFVQIPTIGSQLGLESSKLHDVSSPRTFIISAQSPPSDVAPRPVALSLPSSSTTASAEVRQKLKAALLKTSKTPAAVKPVAEVLPIPKIHTHSATNNILENHQPEVRKEKRVSSTTVEDDHEKRLKTLERNRIAAMRCREKRKKWVADLREKYDRVCSTNEALVKEVMFLRDEVTRLRSALILANNQNRSVQDLSSGGAATVQIVTPEKVLPMDKRNSIPISVSKEVAPSGGGRAGRSNLRLDVEGAAKITAMDLDSPLVRRDEILSSAAPPTTPSEKLITFPELDRDDSEVSEEKMINLSVIQINPNALSKISPGFS